MGVKVATTGRCFQWSSSHPIIPHSQTLPPGKLRRQRRAHTIIRSSSFSSFAPFSFDEDFSRQISSLALAVEPSFLAPPEWHGLAGEETVIQRKANRVEIPVSLRIIKRKLKQEENLTETGESTSMKKAFSSMLFLIRELHIYSLLQMLEAFSSTRGDVEPTLAHMHRELHSSFVWLFQSVFSNSPELMASVMILVANFTVFSMDSHLTSVAPPLPTTEVQAMTRPAERETEKDHSAESPVSAAEGEEGSEARLWREIVEEERRRMEGVFLDTEIVNRFVSSVSAGARIKPDDVGDFFRTEMSYQVGLAQNPNNPLLLVNYAQFLYLFAQDYDRAEEYFKRATKVETKDPEAFSKYASFLWRVRKDLWAAEELLLEAMSADPSNSFYAANYAHFLWDTGGEDTCFPLASPDTAQEV